MPKKEARSLVPGDVLLEPSREVAGTVIQLIPVSWPEIRVVVDQVGAVMLHPSEVVEIQ